jgi:sec-independent protein translocase protein TatA
MIGLDNPLHILLVLVVVLMVFGAKRLPDMGRGIGEGMRSFKQGISGEAPEAPQLTLSAVEEPTASVPATTPSARVADDRTAAPVA